MSDEESIAAIQRRMQAVRQELREEMGQLVASARDMTDWRNYVRSYPWACAAVAASVGYLLVPKSASRLHLAQEDLATVAKLVQGEHRAATARGPSIMSLVGKTIATAALRGVLGYVGHRIAKSSMAEAAPHEPF